MSYFLGIRIDDGLAHALETHARSRGLNKSEAARDLIRRALGASVDESGFQEGLNRAKRKAHQSIAGALRDVEDD